MKAFIVGSAFGLALLAGAAMAAPATVSQVVKACCEAMEKCCDQADKLKCCDDHKAH